MAKLTASDGVAEDYFGYSVGISGDTVVVGAFGDETNRGAAYVFERNQDGADNWGQVAKLTAFDGAAGDYFGRSVAISGDTVVVGAYADNSGQGAAYVFGRNWGAADNWGPMAKLTASDGAAGDFFGQSVAISGDTIVVGADGDDSNRGAAYVFERNQGPVAKLTASDGVASDRFGYSVGISGDTIVVGAEGDDSYRGAAYVFERNQGAPPADNWGQVTKLTASDGAADDLFGFSVGISGDAGVIVVGAIGDETNRGAAYVFERNQGAPPADNWGQVAKLTASDGAADDQFGRSVGISGDTVVVGADDDDSGQGAAYVFERNQDGADNWGQVTKLTASDGATDDFFGRSVGISGDTVVVGASGDESNRGAGYTFVRSGGTWVQESKPTASDGVAGDYFGEAVAVSRDAGAIVVGAERDDDDGDSSGSAYVFTRNQGGADNWGQVAKLTASDGAADDYFGGSVGISRDTVVVGANGNDDDGLASGSAYVFERNQGGADNWGQVAKLTASDGATEGYFGISVGISGDTVVVGAFGDSSFRGAAYVFERNQGGADNWGQVAKLTASDSITGHWFGIGAAVSRDTVVVGAERDNDNGSFSGAAYVFTRNQGGTDNWGQVAKLTASDGAAGDYFGRSVGISGDIVVVGARGDDDNGSASGSAYVFERNQGGADNWGQVTRLTASDGAAGDHFGGSVAISGDAGAIVVGAYLDDDNGYSSGSAYVFERNQGGADNWGQATKLTASDGAANDQFGWSVDISGDTGAIVVGANLDDSGQGAAYVYRLTAGGIYLPGVLKNLAP